jgi:hypothetical protein
MPILTEQDDQRKPRGRRFRWLTAALLILLLPVALAGLLLFFAWLHPIRFTLGGRQFECRWQTYAGAGDPIAVYHPNAVGFEAIVGSGHSYCFVSLGPEPLIVYDTMWFDQAGRLQ